MCLQVEKPVQKKAVLILENGQRFHGLSFGSATSIGGEVGNSNLDSIVQIFQYSILL